MGNQVYRQIYPASRSSWIYQARYVLPDISGPVYPTRYIWLDISGLSGWIYLARSIWDNHIWSDISVQISGGRVKKETKKSSPSRSFFSWDHPILGFPSHFLEC